MALAVGVFTLEPGSAAPVALTSNPGNSLSTIQIAPPTAVTTTMRLNLLPLLTCRVTVQWTAPNMTGLDGFEVRRVIGGTVVAGPWSVVDSPFIDDAVPLATAATIAQWQVRSKYAGTTWRSVWVAASNTDLLPCLLSGNGNAAPDDSGRVADDGLPAATERDEPTEPRTTESGDGPGEQ